MLRILKGNLFTSQCQTLVNTVNCAGVMGAGIALEFKLRYPRMFSEYEAYCSSEKLDVGKLWLYKSGAEGEPGHWVLNFPTKRHWKNPSKPEYLHAGLRNFADTYRRRGIESAAFPILGAQNGGLDEAESISIMVGHLYRCDIDIEIYRYDPNAEDELYCKVWHAVSAEPDEQLVSGMGLRIDRVRALRQVLQEGGVRSIGQLATKQGIGERTLTAALRYATSAAPPGQMALDIGSGPGA